MLVYFYCAANTRMKVNEMSHQHSVTGGRIQCTAVLIVVTKALSFISAMQTQVQNTCSD